MSKGSNVSPDLEAVERDIDKEHLRNHLTTLRFPEAAWRFLAFCEEEHLKERSRTDRVTRHEVACFADAIVNNMKTPLRWLWRRCRHGTHLTTRYGDNQYQASWDFANLGRQYAFFERAYVYARAGALTITLQGDTLVPTGRFRDDTRCEAYDRLYIAPPVNPTSGLDFLRDVAKTVTVAGERFSYKVDSQIVKRGIDELSPIFRALFWLPASWSLPRYSFGDFHATAAALQVRALIHHTARVQAARRGCLAMGYADSVLVFDTLRLLSSLKKYTGLDDAVIAAIVCDITFGGHGVTNPDPALQPLVPLTGTRIAIPPVLLISSNIERNLTVLLNRFPDERDAYSRLSTERESISRERIKAQLEVRGFRFWSGPVPGRRDLPDVDLAIIDDESATCLLLELKAFVGPAEPREVLEKAEEIKRGVEQIRRLRSAWQLNPEVMMRPLTIDDRYSVSFAVASETFVGTADVQDESVPVVRTSHLVRRIVSGTSLSEICRWLSSREYLPVEGRHYEVRDIVASVGSWKVKWYGIKPLIDGEYV